MILLKLQYILGMKFLMKLLQKLSNKNISNNKSVKRLNVVSNYRKYALKLKAYAIQEMKLLWNVLGKELYFANSYFQYQ